MPSFAVDVFCEFHIHDETQQLSVTREKTKYFIMTAHNTSFLSFLFIRNLYEEIKMWRDDEHQKNDRHT